MLFSSKIFCTSYQVMQQIIISKYNLDVSQFYVDFAMLVLVLLLISHCVSSTSNVQLYSIFRPWSTRLWGGGGGGLVVFQPCLLSAQAGQKLVALFVAETNEKILSVFHHPRKSAM